MPGWCEGDDGCHDWDIEVSTGRAIRSHTGPRFGEGEHRVFVLADE